jgi:hypothetical protein
MAPDGLVLSLPDSSSIGRLSVFAGVFLAHILAFLLFNALTKTPALRQAQQLRTEVWLLFERLTRPKQPLVQAHRQATKPATAALPQATPTTSDMPSASPSGAENSSAGEGHGDAGQPGAGTGHSTAVAPLNLSLPAKAIRDKDRPIAEQAAHDPRSNTIRLTPRERFAIAMGEYECVGELRMPDGTIRRGPGKLVPVSGLSRDGLSGNLPMECRISGAF